MRRQYVVCNLTGCTTDGYPSNFTPVRIEIDGEPLQGLACSQAHATALQREWSTLGREIVPELFAAVPA
jgi:hypothetical protein